MIHAHARAHTHRERHTRTAPTSECTLRLSCYAPYMSYVPYMFHIAPTSECIDVSSPATRNAAWAGNSNKCQKRPAIGAKETYYF